MRIFSLRVEGYRSLREVHWTPGKLNLLVGPNGSGKSNLLRLLELISNVARGRLAASLKESGGIVPLLWDHRTTSLGWKLIIDPGVAATNRVDEAPTLEFRIERIGKTSSYEIEVDRLGRWADHEAGGEYSTYRRDPRGASVCDKLQARSVPVLGVDPNESLLAYLADQWVAPLAVSTRKFLEGWRIYHDIHVERGSAMRAPVMTQYEKIVDPRGDNLTSVLHTFYTEDRGFKQRIDDGMTAGFGEDFEELVFQPAAAQQIQLAIRWRSSNKPHAGQDLSDGTLRFLFLLTVLASPEPATLIAIDEPEIGLHPSMMPVVAEYAAEAAERTQVVMTTHSPSFLDAFSEFEPRVAVMLWEGAQTQLRHPTAERLSKWLEKFRLGELFTSGDLDAMTMPDIEPIPDLAERLRALPLEDGSSPAGRIEGEERA